MTKGTALMDNRHVQECKAQCIAAIVQTYATKKRNKILSCKRLSQASDL